MDKSFLDNVAVKKQEQKQQAEKDDNRHIQYAQTDLMNRTTIDAFKTLVKFLDQHQPTVKLSSKDYSKSEDISNLIDSIDELNETNFLSQQTAATELSDKLEELGQSIAELGKKQTSPEVKQNFDAIVKAIKGNDRISITNLTDLAKYFDKLDKTLSSIKLDPTIEVKPTDVTVEKPDLEPLLKELKVVAKAVAGIKIDGPTVNVDTNSVKDAVKKVETAIKSMVFPVPNYVLPYSKDGKAQQVTLGGSGAVPSESPALAVQLDTSADPILYIGKAPIGSATSSAVWQVAKLNTTTGLIKTWADGNSNFDNIYDNRSSLTYS